QEFFSNKGSVPMNGGLNLFAKMLGLPGKMDTDGSEVLRMHQAGQLQAINDYCLCDTLDTYFVFVRSRVMTGDLPKADEARVVAAARQFLQDETARFPVLTKYLAAWSSDQLRS
ncbi:MAG: 3'-5' exonuclease, partial [Gemmataceae bacterium]